VATAAGVVPVGAPRVNDKHIISGTGERKRFSSAILPAWARKSPRSLRCCRCTCTACPAPTSVRRWSSSWSLNSRHHPEQSIDGVASTIV